MIDLLTLQNLRAAQALCDYLTLKGINNCLEKTGDMFTVKIYEAKDYELAKQLAVEFLESPDKKRFFEASWLVENHAPGISRHSIATPTLPLNKIRAHWLTYSVILVCVLVYIIGASGIAPKVYLYLAFPREIDALGVVELLRLITPAFLHFSLLHITFNLLWWWQFGSGIEQHQSWKRLGFILIVTGLSSSVAQAVVVGPNFGGLSGVVYGLLGYLWVYKKLRQESPLNVYPQIVYFMLIWLILGYTNIFASVLGPVANWAHTAGLVSGCFCGFVCAMFDNNLPD